MLTGVIKKKELIDIERPQSKSGVVNKLNKEETVIVLNENGEIFLNNVYYEIDELINNIDPSVGKVTIDIDKKAKISKFNQLLETVGSLNKKKFTLKLLKKKMLLNNKFLVSIILSAIIHIVIVIQLTSNKKKDEEIFVLNLSNYQKFQFSKNQIEKKKKKIRKRTRGKKKFKEEKKIVEKKEKKIVEKKEKK